MSTQLEAFRLNGQRTKEMVEALGDMAGKLTKEVRHPP
jgi:hypothetical protein